MNFTTTIVKWTSPNQVDSTILLNKVFKVACPTIQTLKECLEKSITLLVELQKNLKLEHKFIQNQFKHAWSNCHQGPQIGDRELLALLSFINIHHKSHTFGQSLLITKNSRLIHKVLVLSKNKNCNFGLFIYLWSLLVLKIKEALIAYLYTKYLRRKSNISK